MNDFLQFSIINIYKEFHHSDYQQLCKSDKNQKQFCYTTLTDEDLQKTCND